MNKKQTATTTIDYTLTIARYIASPYWKEMYDLIQIQKASGINRAKSESGRAKALDEHLRKAGMSLAEYDALVEAAARQWHKNDDGRIVVPADNILAFLVQTSKSLRSASRPCDPSSVRAYITATDGVTDKYERDGVYERYAVVTSGTGAKLSNQRALRSNEYIENVTMTGSFTFRDNYVDPKRLHDALALGGVTVGIGACRPQGYGRFEVASWEQR